MSNSLQPHGLYPTRLLSPWNFPSKNTEVGCHFLLQGIFPTQGSNPSLLHYRQMLYRLSHQRSPPGKLNKQGGNIQPWCTPFPIWNQSVVPCPVLTVASWPAYRFLKRQDRWSGIPISSRIFQFIVIHTVKVFGIVNTAEIDVFLELSCFFDDPVNVGNLISDSSAFTKTSLNIWKFMVQVLLKCVSCDRRCRSTAERTYPTSKVRRSGCTLLEQPWRDTSHPR